MVLKGCHYLPGLICCFFTEASSPWAPSVEPCLKTTGAREIEAAEAVEEEESRRFAYSERPPLRGGAGVEGFDMINGLERFGVENC